ncbi:hypothetical protein ACFQ3Z_29620 [Streptomyces nogalater]
MLSAATRGEAEQVLEGAARRPDGVSRPWWRRRTCPTDRARTCCGRPALFRRPGACCCPTAVSGPVRARAASRCCLPARTRMICGRGWSGCSYDTAPEDQQKGLVKGDRRDADVYRVVRFLLLNHVPFDVRDAPAGQAGVTVWIDGRELRNPPLITLAEALHLTRYSGGSDYDVVVVGGGRG